jgi:glycine cleavage system aminomethyltransferase T
LCSTIALAIVPRDLATPGTRVEVEHAGRTYAAVVAALPT